MGAKGMSVDDLITALSKIEEEEAMRVAKAILTTETALGRAMNVSVKAMVAHYMIQCSAENSEEAELYKKLYGNFMTAVVKETFKQAQEMCFLPFKHFYSESEVNKLLGKGSQYLKTRRSSGKSVPKPCLTDGPNVYSVIDVMDFVDKSRSNGGGKMPSERSILLIAGELENLIAKVNRIVFRFKQK
jgi:hypothetical protein